VPGSNRTSSHAFSDPTTQFCAVFIAGFTMPATFGFTPACVGPVANGPVATHCRSDVSFREVTGTAAVAYTPYTSLLSASWVLYQYRFCRGPGQDSVAGAGFSPDCSPATFRAACALCASGAASANSRPTFLVFLNNFFSGPQGQVLFIIFQENSYEEVFMLFPFCPGPVGCCRCIGGL